MIRICNFFKFFIRKSVNPFYGFIEGHWRLTNQFIRDVENELLFPSNIFVENFERKFSELIGDGECVAFASGRMSFFALLKALKVSTGDEVILLGFTCSVMVNAVIRTGAKPVFSDIDVNTFGSSVKSIENCISSNTKVVVAQHSFGIPCEIERIRELTINNNIFLVEDCAISLGSKVKGKSIGDFGDASLFSTDHSKPINTFTGGLIYSKNSLLIEKLRFIQNQSPDLSIKKQIAIFKRLKIERKFSNPKRYYNLIRLNLIYHLIGGTSPFLDQDFGVRENLKCDYPYPAKLPSFLAKIGIEQVENWDLVSKERKMNFSAIIEVIKNSNSSKFLPNAYFDTNLNIIPLRVVWSESNGPNIREKLSSFLHVEWTWFLFPIIVTKESLENYGYFSGMCPNSESLGIGMINIPCNHHKADVKLLCEKIKESLVDL